jgi:hypothetical protein
MEKVNPHPRISYAGLIPARQRLPSDLHHGNVLASSPRYPIGSSLKLSSVKVNGMSPSWNVSSVRFDNAYCGQNIVLDKEADEGLVKTFGSRLLIKFTM